jgi:hypothetical protein
VSEFQDKFMMVLDSMPNRIASTNEMSWKMKTSYVAIVSAGRALERKGLVHTFRSDNSQWAALMWASRTRYVEAMKADSAKTEAT